jgi:hypothetical protein
MTPGAWLYMLAVWGVIIAVNIFCFVKIFKKNAQRPPSS